MNNTHTNRTTTQPICVAQLNAQKKKEAVTQLLNQHVQDFDIIILQEPAWGFIGKSGGKDILGPVALQGWNPIIPITNINNIAPKKPRTLTYFHSRPDFTVTLRSDLIEDCNIQILDIEQHNQPLTTLINVYNDPRLQQQSTLNWLRHINLPREHPVIIMGNFNLHHDMWAANPVGNDDARTSGVIVDWLSEEGFTMLNKKGEITHPPRNTHERASVIDLTFVNGQAIQAGTVKEWAIDPGIAHDADHLGIKFLIAHGQVEIENPMDTKYCLKDVKLDEWTKEFENAIQGSEEELQPLLHPEPLTPNTLDRCADALKTALQTATAKTWKPCANAKPWWDDDLAQAANRVSDAWKEQKRHHDTVNAFSGDIRS